eukprot:gene5405-6556_t
MTIYGQIAKIDRLYLLAVPNEEFYDEDATAKTILLEKQQRLAAAEKQWLESFEKTKKDDSAESDGGWVQSYLDTILGNLQLEVTNVHVRFEGNFQSRSIAAGVTLESISASTVDKDGNAKFDVAGLAKRLYKSVDLKRLAVYVDPDAAPFMPTKPWKSMLAEEMDQFFLPGIKQEAKGRQFVFKPLSGNLQYTKRGTKEPAVDCEPEHKMSLSLGSIALLVTELQLRDSQLLLEGLSTATMRAPYNHIRPQCGIQADTRAWWKFAFEGVMISIGGRRSKFCWDDVLRVAQARRRYVELYKKQLLSKHPDKGITKELESFDKQLDVEVCLLFRCTAHTEIKAAEKTKAKKSSWSWFGASKTDSTEKEQEISTEDWEKMQEVFQIDKDITKGVASPYALQMEFQVQVDRVSLQLQSQEGIEVLGSSLEKMQVGICMYPETKSINFGYRASFINTPEGRLLETSTTGEEKGRAAYVEYTMSPQDGQADAVVRALFMPCLITVNRRSLDRLLEFVSPPQAMDTSSLQTQVKAELYKKSQEVQEMIKERQKRSLIVHLELKAPIIRIRPRTQDVAYQMVVNLGTFVLASDEMAKGKSAEDRAWYDSYTLDGYNISAGFYDSKLDWPALQCILDDGDGGDPTQLPVLAPTALQINLDMAQAEHPSRPKLRTKLRIPAINVMVSPKRMHCLVRAISDVTTSTTPRLASQPVVQPWAAAEYSGALQLVTSDGVGRFKLYKRWAALKGGYLYLLEHENSPGYSECVPIGRNQTIHDIPCAEIGMSNVFAIASEQLAWDTSKLLESARQGRGTSLLQAADESAHVLWVGFLSEACARFQTSSLSIDEPSEGDATPKTKATCISLQAEIELQEVKLLVSGRTHNEHGVLGDVEEDIIAVAAMGTSLSFTQRLHDMSAGLTMQSFEVDDLLSGKLHPSLGRLVSTRSLSKPAARSLLVQYSAWSLESPDYANVDAELAVELSTLHFCCNRRTIVALLALPQDMFADRAVPAQEPAGGTPAPSGAEARSIMLIKDRTRVLFKLRAVLSKVDLRLNYEDGTSLALVSVDNLSSDVATFADSLSVSASLGGVHIENQHVEAAHPNHWICRNSDRVAESDSLLTLAFRTFDRKAVDYPGYDSSLKVNASELSIVFLFSFIQEALRYLTALMGARASPTAEPGVQAVEAAPAAPDGALASGSPAAAVPGTVPEVPYTFNLEVAMNAPVIFMPQHSGSKDGIHLDLGQLDVRNELKWSAEGVGAVGAVLVEITTVHIGGLELFLITDGVRGVNLVHKWEGARVNLRRPIVDAAASLPGVHVLLELAQIHLDLTSAQFQLLTTCAGENFGEPPFCEPPVFAGAPTKPQATAQVADVAKLEGANSAEALADADKAKFMLSVHIQDIELHLLRTEPVAQHLATFQISKLGFGLVSKNSGDMKLRLSISSAELYDQRLGAEDTFLVLSSSIGKGGDRPDAKSPMPALLHIDFSTCSGNQEVIRFFIPTFAGGTAEVADQMLPTDINLSCGKYVADGDVTLSRFARILADVDACDDEQFEFDGQGHRLYLPEGDRTPPVILIGPHKRLVFRNLTIMVDEGALHQHISLGVGASFSVKPSDGVQLQAPCMDADAQLVASETQSPAAKAPAATTSMDIKLQVYGLKVIAQEVESVNETGEFGTSSGSRFLQAELDLLVNVYMAEAMGVSAVVSRLSLEAHGAKGNDGGMQVLAPCELMANYNDSAEGTRVILGTTPLLTRFSPHVLLLTKSVVFQMSVACGGSSDALRPVKKFERLWSDAVVSGGVLDSEEGTRATGLSFWRPQVPHGYCLLGDCVTYGDQPPHTEVQVARDSTALLTPPASYALAWRSGEGKGAVSVWTPLPRNGFVALGCVASIGPDPPALDTMRCVRQELVRRSAAVACLSRLNGSVWQVGNASATFVAQAEAQPARGQIWELREPLGLKSAGGGAGDSSAPLQLSAEAERLRQSGSMNRRKSMAAPSKVVVVRVMPVVEDRIWWDKGAKSTAGAEFGEWSKVHMSVWRPVSLQGLHTASLGDVAVPNSYDAPKHLFAAVDTGDGAVAPPRDYERVWRDGGGSRKNGSAFWRPVPPVGYVALGHVVSRGHHKPALDAMFCVHESLVSAHAVRKEHLAWDSRGAWAKLGSAPTSVWQGDTTLGTFISVSVNSSAVNLSTLTAHSLEQMQMIDTPPNPPGIGPAERRLSTSAAAAQECLHARTVATLRHIWWSEGLRAHQVTFWRPSPPKGYFALGDCVTRGTIYPTGVRVFQDPMCAEGNSSAGGLLVPPVGFKMVWGDCGSRGRTVSLWQALPPPGYVALGFLCSKGHERPPFSAIRCVRRDLAVQLSADNLPHSSSVFSEKGATGKIGSDKFSVWALEENLYTFAAVGNHKPPPAELRWALRTTTAVVPATSAAAPVPVDDPKPPRTMSVKMEVRGLRVTLNSETAGVATPLLELRLTEVSAQVKGTTAHMQLSGELLPAVDCFNTRYRAWEPLVEPFPLLLQADICSSTSAQGLPPGTHLQ